MMDVRATIDGIASLARVQGFSVEVIDTCASGEVIGLVRRVSTASQWIYLSAGMHGDEPAGPLAIMNLFEAGYFAEQKGVNWMICPALNPDGLAAETREDAHGVDMNRDYYKCRNKTVCGHIRWLESLPVPDLFLSLHEDWESTGLYLYEIDLDAGPSFANRLLDGVVDLYEREPEEVIDDHAVTEKGWIYHAAEPDLEDDWPEAIWVAKRECPLSFTFETPSSNGPVEKRAECHARLVQMAVATVCEGH